MNEELNNTETHLTDNGTMNCFTDYLDEIYFDGYAETYIKEQPDAFHQEYKTYISNYSFGESKEVC